MRRDRRHGRNVNGILLLDKPIGCTSNAVLQTLKKMYGARKAGHTGSLDPIASGMLPICFGEATKFSQFLLQADKVYKVTAKLGIKTETGDTEGDVVSTRDVGEIDASQLETILDTPKKPSSPASVRPSSVPSVPPTATKTCWKTRTKSPAEHWPRGSTRAPRSKSFPWISPM